MKRWDLINELIKKNNYKNYLEIGYGIGENFKNINAENKTSVDPNVNECTYTITSDAFFEMNKEKFDIIFIDGLHIYDQVKRDFYNSISILNDGGIIVIHDCSPTTYEMQLTVAGAGEWTGDVWRLIVHLKNNHEDYLVSVVDTDYGCGLVKKGKQELIKFKDDISYEEFSNNRKEILNLISVEDFIESLK